MSSLSFLDTSHLLDIYNVNISFYALAYIFSILVPIWRVEFFLLIKFNLTILSLVLAFCVLFRKSLLTLKKANFINLDLMFQFTTHFDFFLCVAWGKWASFFFCMWVSYCFRAFVEKTVFSPLNYYGTLVKNQLYRRKAYIHLFLESLFCFID